MTMFFYNLANSINTEQEKLIKKLNYEVEDESFLISSFIDKLIICSKSSEDIDEEWENLTDEERMSMANYTLKWINEFRLVQSYDRPEIDKVQRLIERYIFMKNLKIKISILSPENAKKFLFEKKIFIESSEKDNKDDILDIINQYEKELYTNTLQPIVKQKPEPNGKLITIKNSETVEKLHSELKEYFPNKEAELLKALKGEQLSEILLYPHNGSSFVEVFKRLKYNGLLISTPTEIKDWICINFNFVKTQGTKKTVEAFKEDTVWGVLTKTRCEPSKKNRICTPDWLPFIPQKTRQREAKNEKL